jgi:GNAT superfamily N-acetyltransferase
MELRRARKEDIDSIWAVYAEGIRAMKSAGIDQWDEIYPTRKDIARDIADGSMYVLEKGGRILSAVTLDTAAAPEYIDGHWQYDLPYYVVHRLCVHPESQGKGIAAYTMRLAEERAKGQGLGALRLDAFAQNPAALRLYEKLGYQNVGSVRFRKGRYFLFEKSIG